MAEVGLLPTGDSTGCWKAVTPVSTGLRCGSDYRHVALNHSPEYTLYQETANQPAYEWAQGPYELTGVLQIGAAIHLVQRELLSSVSERHLLVAKNQAPRRLQGDFLDGGDSQRT